MRAARRPARRYPRRGREAARFRASRLQGRALRQPRRRSRGKCQLGSRTSGGFQRGRDSRPPSQPGSGQPSRRRPSISEGHEIASVDSVRGLMRELHVLLRHRLLPQPHGFEGLVSGLVDGHPRDLSVANLGDPSRPGPNRNPARPSRVDDPDWNNNAVASVDEVLSLRPYVAPSVGQHREIVPNPLVPAVGAPAQGAPRRVDYAIDIASRDRREQPFDDLHALLRHRPPSIPRRPCGVIAAPIYTEVARLSRRSGFSGYRFSSKSIARRRVIAEFVPLVQSRGNRTGGDAWRESWYSSGRPRSKFSADDRRA